MQKRHKLLIIGEHELPSSKKKKKIVETNSTRFLDTGFKVNPDGSATTTVF